MDTANKIKAIKAQFRSFMNGAVSYSMRKKGLDDYKLNFGIEYPRLKEIAKENEPNIALAEALWIENIRECKILATLLYPKELFDLQTANLWISQTSNIEIARMLCMNLLQHMPYAPNLSFICIANEKDLIQTIGYLTIARILPDKASMSERAADEFLNQIVTAAQAEDYQLRQAATLAAISFMQQGEIAKAKMLVSIDSLENSSNQFGVIFHNAIIEEASFL